jgi:hypothetical protein
MRYKIAKNINSTLYAVLKQPKHVSVSAFVGCLFQFLAASVNFGLS